MRYIKRHATVLVLCIWSIGLVSLLFGTLIVDREVVFVDPNLEAVVRETINQPAKPIHASSLGKITVLDASGRGISSLAGIESLYNLTVLNLENNHVSDVSPLEELKKLKQLNLINNGLTNLEEANFDALANIPIKEINLDYNVLFTPDGQPVWLSDIEVLGKIQSLQKLTLSENKITDISPLSSLVNMRTLILDSNLIQDISALQFMESIKTLSLANNDVVDLMPLTDLHQIEHLYLQSNERIDSLLPLKNLQSLKTVFLDHVYIGEQVSLLAGLTNLEILSLSNGHVVDISTLNGLKHLTELHLRDNDIIDLSPLSNFTRLEELDLQSNTHIKSIRPIQKLTLLEKLDLQNVPVGQDIFMIAELDRLKFLDVRNCSITDTSVLGELMGKGALQNDPYSGELASIDLRDNPITEAGADPYAPIRQYWNNIGERVPFALPESAAIAPPVFSSPGGYYERPFELEITTDIANAQIYYTLDGSEPTNESLLYTAPIQIRSRVGEPNTFSEIQEVSPRWIPPDGDVFKATVVRARAISDDGLSSAIITNTYIVDKANRYTLPVISLVTDPSYLFDYKYGIYVMGEIYDQFYDSTSGLNPWERPANYTQRGQAWERPMHIEYYDPSGSLGFSQNVSVRIQGAASRERSQKSLRIYSSCDGSCDDSIDYELFPDLTSEVTGYPIQEFNTFILRNSGNDWEKTMFRDALVHALVKNTRVDIQAYQPAIVFLNGEYWGIHNLRERQDEFYLQSHYGVNPEDIVILSGKGVIESGTAGDEQHYLNLLDFIETSDLKEPQNYEHVKTQMDVDNYIDYEIAEIYSNNTNWPNVNIEFWRKKTTSFEPHAPYGQDGRWRWMIYDMDFAFGLDDGLESSANNNLVHAINPPGNGWAGFLFRSLLENHEFKIQFINRFMDHLNSTFAPQQVLDVINQMEATIEPEMEEHIRRWRGEEGNLEQWRENVDVMRYFAQTRPDFMIQHLMDYFRLSGVAKVNLYTDSKQGYIRINSLDIVSGVPGITNPEEWTGDYFKGVPIDLTAVPKPGYKFLKWEISDQDDVVIEKLSLTLTQDISVRAIFVEDH